MKRVYSLNKFVYFASCVLITFRSKFFRTSNVCSRSLAFPRPFQSMMAYLTSSVVLEIASVIICSVIGRAYCAIMWERANLLFNWIGLKFGQ